MSPVVKQGFINDGEVVTDANSTSQQNIKMSTDVAEYQVDSVFLTIVSKTD